MTNNNDGVSLNNLVWGILFSAWGVFWLLVTFGLTGFPSDAMVFLIQLSPLFWVVLGLILFFHDDGKIEEVRP